MFTFFTMNTFSTLSDQAAATLSGGYDCNPKPNYPCEPKQPDYSWMAKLYLPKIYLPKIEIKWGCYTPKHKTSYC
jgi:hypothetical protein